MHPLDKGHRSVTLHVRVPEWLKRAIENSAVADVETGKVITATDVAREILWTRFAHARPKPQPVERGS